MSGDKTPVSILNEMMAKLGKTPTYELCSNKLEAISPQIFIYKVTCDGVEATGSGKSKKDAKHNAASAILGMLRKATVVPESLPAKSKSPVQIMKVLRACTNAAPSADNNLNNTVQELMTLCCKYKLEEPVYKELEVSGPPHARIYTIQCSLSTISVTGTGNTKKQAKKKAAKLMVDRVKDIFCIDNYSNGIGNKRQKLLSSKEVSLA